MDRRKFLAAVTSGTAVVAGCASSGSSGPDPAGTETSTETIRDGPTVNVPLTEAPTNTSMTTPVVVTTTGPITITPTLTESTERDSLGSSSGGGSGSVPSGPTTGSPIDTPTPPEPTESDTSGSSSGGSSGSGPSAPATATPTATPDESDADEPIYLTLSIVTVTRVVGELTCTAGPLAWMKVEIEYLQDGVQLESTQEKKETPDTDDTLAFDVERETTDHDSLRITTGYAYPDQT